MATSEQGCWFYECLMGATTYVNVPTQPAYQTTHFRIGTFVWPDEGYDGDE